MFQRQRKWFQRGCLKFCRVLRITWDSQWYYVKKCQNICYVKYNNNKTKINLLQRKKNLIIDFRGASAWFTGNQHKTMAVGTWPGRSNDANEVVPDSGVCSHRPLCLAYLGKEVLSYSSQLPRRPAVSHTILCSFVFSSLFSIWALFFSVNKKSVIWLVTKKKIRKPHRASLSPFILMRSHTMRDEKTLICLDIEK